MRCTLPGNNVPADLEFEVMDVESTTKSTFVDVLFDVDEYYYGAA